MSIPQTEAHIRFDSIDDAKKRELVKRELASRVLTIAEFLTILEWDLGYFFEHWQRNQIYIAVDPNNDEVLIIRCRGGSKTFDMMVVLLFFSYHGLHCIFWCSVARQKEQPKKYLKFLCSKTFLQYAIEPGRLLSEEVYFKNDGWLWIGNLTPDNARSPRCDVVYFDEQSRADPEGIDASDSELSVSKLAKTIHGSTPEKGTVFEQNYNRLKKEGKPVLERKWNQIGFLNKKKILQNKAKWPAWYFRQENECSFEAPQGRVFTHLIEGDFSHLFDQGLNYISFGVDWNPAAGHFIAGTQWHNEFKYCVAILEEDMGTDLKIVHDRLLWYAEEYPKAKFELEDGGANIGFCDGFEKYLMDNRDYYSELLEYPNDSDIIREYKYKLRVIESLIPRIERREWDTAGKNKMQAITWLMPLPIYHNEIVTPGVSDWLDKAHWDEEATDTWKLKKHKDQHPLDAFLHSAYIGRDQPMFDINFVSRE